MAKTLADIRKYKKRAMKNRLKGQIARAMADENLIDTLIHWAKREGFGQEAEDAELEAGG